MFLFFILCIQTLPECCLNYSWNKWFLFDSKVLLLWHLRSMCIYICIYLFSCAICCHYFLYSDTIVHVLLTVTFFFFFFFFLLTKQQHWLGIRPSVHIFPFLDLANSILDLFCVLIYDCSVSAGLCTNTLLLD